MQQTVRRDFCPDCGYEFYYGDAHAQPPLNQSREIRSHWETWTPPEEPDFRADDEMEEF